MAKFIKDTTFTLLNQLLIILMSLITAGIIARALGPMGRGTYALAILLSGIAVITTQFGIGGSSIYYLGRKKYETKEILGNNIIFTAYLSFIGIAIGVAIIFFLSGYLLPGVDKRYLLLALLFIPLQHFFNFISNILLGLKKIKKYNLVFLIQNITFLLLITVASLKI